MSDEEKKAMKLLNDMIKHKPDTIRLEWRKGIYALQLVLNLIEKQSKEIEELKNADLTTVYLNGFYDGEKKVKDKIKAKIEEYDDKGMTVNLANRSAGKTFQQAVHYEVKKVLQYF